MKIYKQKGGDRIFAIDNGDIFELEEFNNQSAIRLGQDVQKTEFRRLDVKVKAKASPGNHTIYSGPNSWSKKHDKCVDCKTADNPYKSGGRCSKCYSKFHANEIKEKRSGNKLYARENSRKVKVEELRGWRCTECNHEFESIKAKLDITCPKCNDIHCIRAI